MAKEKLIQEIKWVIGMQLMAEIEPELLRGRESANIFINMNKQCRKLSNNLYSAFSEEKQVIFNQVIGGIEDFIEKTVEVE